MVELASDGEAVRAVVREIIARMSPLGPCEPKPEDRIIEDLGYDSLATIELAVELENRLGLGEIQEEDAMEVVTVAEVEQLVLRVIGEAGAPRD